ISNMLAASTHLTLPHIALAEPQSVLTDIDEALSLLSLEEIKKFAKETKCSGTTKSQILASLSHMAKTQAAFAKKSNGQVTLNFTSKGELQSRTDHCMRKVLAKI